MDFIKPVSALALGRARRGSDRSSRTNQHFRSCMIAGSSRGSIDFLIDGCYLMDAHEPFWRYEVNV